jgi:hypothetical protein
VKDEDFFVIPNLIWKPANYGRGSVLPHGKLASPRTLPRPMSRWFSDQVRNDEEMLLTRLPRTA